MDKQLEPLLGEDLLHLKEYQIGEKLSAYPWIDHWQMHKHPHTLILHVYPKKPVAKWNDHWVDAHASLFKAADFAGSWMTLEGQQEDLPSLVRRCMEWQHHLQEAVIEQCAYKKGQWQLQLGSGPRIQLGSEFLEERVEKLGFILHATQAWKAWRMLDLRYPHGFAYH